MTPRLCPGLLLLVALPVCAPLGGLVKILSPLAGGRFPLGTCVGVEVRVETGAGTGAAWTWEVCLESEGKAHSCGTASAPADPAQRVLALRRAGEMRRHRGGSEQDLSEEDDLEPGANSGSGATALHCDGAVAEDAGGAERGKARQDSGAGAGIDEQSDARRDAGEGEGSSHTAEAAVAREGDAAEEAGEGSSHTAAVRGEHDGKAQGCGFDAQDCVCRKCRRVADAIPWQGVRRGEERAGLGVDR